MIMTRKFDIRNHLHNWGEWLHDLSASEINRINRAADGFAAWRRIWKNETWEYVHRGDRKRARRIARQAIRIGPDAIDSYVILARTSDIPGGNRLCP